MRTADVIEQLKRSGFSANEARILVSLGRHGSPTASDLATDTELNRVQVYRTLEGLEARGFVDVSL
ncbi:MAG: helix-turn-helix domain-containing protein, partial [Nitrospirales bacterium]